MPQDLATSLSMANLHKKFSESSPKNLNSKVEYPSQHLSFQLQDQHSSSTQSTGSYHEVTAMGKTSSQDQCASADSDVLDQSCGKCVQEVIPTLLLGNPDSFISPSQAEISQPMVPYAYSDPYLSRLYTSYGPHAMFQPQVMGSASIRVPLPVDISEDGPIYVNAKQYHGILRRRQTRAKLEAQNKLIKNRKPYLHESRHLHALNRVRGSGGRFLSSKKPQQPNSTHSSSSLGMVDSLHVEADTNETPIEATRVGNGDVVFSQSNSMFSSVQSNVVVPMQGSSGLVYHGNRHYASIVR
ncbi:nuclear transcription factor Y subunit A-7-like isoform X2 [Olea europaea var. sylvestris]|uniref:nuclear transcription factor Y subunit A-7-like isoform X2 n=1 Tax=Olea europaea var. sylvestris TaxID=158386 RepID=UPI000C1D3CD9|nr:nuclear transcription factor Y subunit A-7-like isoform X2 [Olea europaea var. sylvestris]